MSHAHLVRRSLVAALAVILMAVAGLMSSATASAHEVGASLITYEFTDDGAAFEISVPLDRLELALDMGTTFTDDPEGAVAEHDAMLRAVFAAGMTVSAESGTWPIELGELGVDTQDGVPTLTVQAIAAASGGDAGTSFTLDYHVITDQDTTHKVYVASISPDGSVTFAGVLTAGSPTIAISSDTAPTAGFGEMITTGWAHFRQGVDHQAFLLVVALAAVARGRGVRHHLKDLAVLTAAFSLGHSVSLALATLEIVTLPTRIIETAIAVTILIAAVHVFRPLVPPRREPVVTFAFGLVHGFGFAGTLELLGVSGLGVVVPTFGFNVGLELAQLAALTLTIGPLLWLARSKAATYAVAAAVGVVALSWMTERAFDTTNPVDRWANTIAATPERLALAVLITAAASALAHQRLSGRGGPRNRDSPRPERRWRRSGVACGDGRDRLAARARPRHRLAGAARSHGRLAR